MNEILDTIAEAIIKGDAIDVKKITQQAIEDGFTPKQILNQGLIAGMNVVGVRFKANDMFVPEVMLSARAMHAGLNLLKPLLAQSQVKEKGVFVIGTVKGDLHDIGKNLLVMLLEGAGYKVIDLGINVPAAKFIQAIEEYSPDIVGLSALLTTTLSAMQDTIKEIVNAGLRDRTKILVGGAPVTQAYADEIGADGYASDAGSAVELANRIIR